MKKKQAKSRMGKGINTVTPAAVTRRNEGEEREGRAWTS